jgi:hypothetical protein
MKQFAVELRRTSYVTVYVDAETKEQAEDKVWNEAEYGAYDDGDASWECSDIYEQFATDESRNTGVTA